MANFPLVLAIEPRLLPYARANGFTMDHKVSFSALHHTPALCTHGSEPVSELRFPQDV